MFTAILATFSWGDSRNDLPLRDGLFLNSQDISDDV